MTACEHRTQLPLCSLSSCLYVCLLPRTELLDRSLMGATPSVLATSTIFSMRFEMAELEYMIIELLTQTVWL
jgi:hypothetical protein